MYLQKGCEYNSGSTVLLLSRSIKVPAALLLQKTIINSKISGNSIYYTINDSVNSICCLSQLSFIYQMFFILKFDQKISDSLTYNAFISYMSNI